MKKLIVILFSLLCLSCIMIACESNHTHDFLEYETIVAADCYNNGVLNRKCKDCGYSEIRVVEKKNHFFTETSRSKNTCESDGYIIEKCMLCDSEKITVIPKLNHCFVTNITEADCYNPKRTMKTCETCGYVSLEEEGKPRSHEFEFFSTVRGECGKIGTNIFVCSLCNYQKIESNDSVSEHMYEVVRSVSATCTDDGEVISQCVYCGNIKNVILPKTEHDFQIRRIEPTCESEGKVIQYCLNGNCGYEQILEKSEMIPHKMTTEIVSETIVLFSYDGNFLYKDKACEVVCSVPRCMKNKNDSFFVCDDCGFNVGVVEHDFQIRDTATCVKGGFKENYCRNCGEILSSIESEPKGHKNSSAEYLCSVDNNLTVLYRVNGGDSSVEICYRCDDCGEFIATVPHVPDCDIDEVSCLKPQVCKVCSVALNSVDHVAPELKCVSSKNDGNYYCIMCEQYAMGKLASHNYESTIKSGATCTDNVIYYLSCKCGAGYESETANSALGHIIPDDCKQCVENDDLTYAYFFKYNKLVSIAYQCSRCNEYFETVGHSFSCSKEDVRCDNPQYCLVCNEVFIKKEHVVPEITCCSSKNDEYYYCVDCQKYAIGRLTEHEYVNIEDARTATCTTNEFVLKKCKCGDDNPEGYTEVLGTALGHRVSVLQNIDQVDCMQGHKLKCSGGKCENGCGLNFENIVSSGTLYCSDLYKYFIENGYTDDFLTDENSGKIGSSRLLSLLQCCSLTNYRFTSHEHVFGDEPFVTTDYEYDNTLFEYIPSTCSTKGSAVFECVNCGNLSYKQNYMRLNLNNHESEVLTCGEHCKYCAPIDGNCMFSLKIEVLRENGEDAIVNGLPLTATYGAAFLFSNGRLEAVTNERGDVIYYILSDSFIAQIIASNGICYSSADAAKKGDSTQVIDWSSVKLYKNVDNVITFYISGVNEEN